MKNNNNPTFRTIVEVSKSANKISYETPVMFIGSCFTENVGNKMLDLKFPAVVNPFGILYNPISVANLTALVPVISNS